MSDVIAARRPVLAGERYANSAVTLETLPPLTRYVLRATREGGDLFGQSIAMDLPDTVGDVTTAKSRTVMKLGPDEWMVLDSNAEAESLQPNLPNAEFSLVDISHRNCGFRAEGKGVTAMLNAGCPRDLRLSSFPVGRAARTVFGKVEVVLLRLGEEEFHIECWRSFAPYVHTYLQSAAKDAALVV